MCYLVVFLVFFVLFVYVDMVGKVGVDWVGNDIIIEVIVDFEVVGVICYLVYFDRLVFDWLKKGNWFEDLLNLVIECVWIGLIWIGDIQ